MSSEPHLGSSASPAPPGIRQTARWSSTVTASPMSGRMRPVVVRLRPDAAGALVRAVAGDDYAHDVRAGWAPPSKPARRTLPLIVVVLTFPTGVVDAVSYLGLGRVFAGSPTGDLVVIGCALPGT